MEECDDSTYDEGGPTVFQGMYRHGFETSLFRAEGSKCDWYLSGDFGPLGDELQKRWPYLRAIVTLRVEGTLTPPGCYGHMGIGHRELKATKVISYMITSVEPLPSDR